MSVSTLFDLYLIKFQEMLPENFFGQSVFGFSCNFDAAHCGFLLIALRLYFLDHVQEWLQNDELFLLDCIKPIDNLGSVFKIRVE